MSPADVAAALGLTEDEAARIEKAMTAAHAVSTRTVYACAWRRFARWATDRGVDALPADPAAVCAYLTERAAGGLSAATVDVACSAIGHEHRRNGLPDPIAHPGVRQVRRGLRRLLGAQPRRLARPLDTDEIRQMVTAIDRTTAKGARDAALILLGFASAMRISELAALRLADLSSSGFSMQVGPRTGSSTPCWVEGAAASRVKI